MSNRDASSTVGKLSYWDLLELNGYGNVPMSYMDISKPSYVTGYDAAKIYLQKRTVTYADYKPDFWYVSPFDVRIAK